MDRYIAEENIKRFRSLLERCTDGAQRETLKQLLADEERRLATLQHRHVLHVRASQ